MTVKDKSSIRILIAGGGPAGLLAAQALKKQGYSCRVFEQDPYHGARQRDWSFGIYWAQQPLNDCLTDELVAKVIKNGQVDNRPMDPNGILPMYNSMTGELMKNVPIPNQIRIHRLNFLKIIAEGLNIEYGKRIQSVSSNNQTVLLTFEDGTSAEGDFLIGAEGAHSKVREYLMGKEKAALRPAPFAASFTKAKLPKEGSIAARSAHPRFFAHLDDQGAVWIVAVHDAWEGTEPGDWSWSFIWSRPCAEDYDPSVLQGPAILQDIKKRCAGFAEPFRMIWTSIPDDTKYWHTRLSYWVTEPWNNRNGTITLIGDAAHPMTYHRGQGGNNAILDVASLARCVADKGLLRSELDPSSQSQQTGLEAFEQDIWQRGQEAVTTSLENSIMLHDWEKVTGSHLCVSGAVQRVGKTEEMTKAVSATNGENGVRVADTPEVVVEAAAKSAVA